jgi:GNAT superfamily N-acetyltransferase
VLHRNALRADFRGTGAAEALMQAVAEEASARGAVSVRVDTHRKNKPMRALLERCGYRYAGNVLVESEPGHDPRRQAFEKALN